VIGLSVQIVKIGRNSNDKPRISKNITPPPTHTLSPLWYLLDPTSQGGLWRRMCHLTVQSTLIETAIYCLQNKSI